MQEDFLIFSGEAQRKLKKGVDTLNKAVTLTMGPLGKLVLIEKKSAPPHLTKDGATVASNINLRDRFENLGASIVKQASVSTAQIAGDGSTTAVSLTQSFYEKCLQALDSGAINTTELCNSLRECQDLIVEILDKNVTQVKSRKDLEHIATISANGDERVGEIIVSAVDEVGETGLISVEESKTTQTSLEIVNGSKVNRGYISPYFINRPELSRCDLEDTLILLCNNRVENVSQILPILEKIHQDKKSLLIMAPDYSQEVIQNLVANATKGLLKICAIRLPFYGEKREDILTDLSMLLDCQILHGFDHDEVSSFGLNSLGKCNKVEITHDESLFIGYKANEKLDERIQNIVDISKNPTTTEEEQKFCLDRLSLLTGSAAVIKVGAHTESELLELKDRIDDALHATKSGIAAGYLPGGGIALARAALILKENKDINHIVKNIFVSACFAPIRNILSNADLATDYIIELLKNTSSFNKGYNVSKQEIVDMIEEGIIDPFIVTATALANAISATCSLISIGCISLETEDMSNEVESYCLTEDTYS